ncbi:MAG: molybdopterin converting factor subunit 1 [Planctomycetes bacterium]|nr:molybdopterin converting factor subunit 1 [Planctomycetota bacterium]
MPPRFELEVHLFASVREAVGRDRVRVALDAPARAADLLDGLAREHPAIAAARRSLAVAVNQAIVGPDHALAPGDEVALIPPVGGG